MVTKAATRSLRAAEPAVGAAASPPDGAAAVAVAGLRARLRATLLDVLAVVPLAVLGGWAVLVAILDYELHHATGDMGFGDVVRVTVAQWAPMVAVLAAIVVLWGLVSLARRGATPGMRGAGIKVARWRDGSPVGLGGALLRRAVPGVPLLIGVIAFARALWSGTEGNPAIWLALVSLTVWTLVHASVLWDPQRRGWADKAASTVVVYSNERPMSTLAMSQRSDRGLLTR